MKKIISIILSFILFFNLAIVLTSCEAEKNAPVRDTNVTIKIQGVNVAKRLNVKLTNLVTNEVYNIKFSGIPNWENKMNLDYGTYRVDEVATQGINSDVTFPPQTFTVTEETTNVDIQVNEVDHTGTFLWFLQKNILTLTGLFGCLIGMAIVKVKKNKKIQSSDGIE